MAEFNYIVTEDDKELTISKLLKRNYNFSSRLMAKLKSEELIYLNGEKAKNWIVPAVGDKLTVILPTETSDFPPEDIPINVIFEDENILVINKQPGFVVHPTKGKPYNTMANGIMNKMIHDGENYKIRFANRLDMNTSGLLVVAKNSFSQDNLVKQMQHDGIEKRYIAVVDGIIDEDSGTINMPIGRPDPNEVERWILSEDKGGYPSITRYFVKERYPKKDNGYTLVELKLDTGRTHQIRVHMSYFGHPVTGDHLYNNGDPFLYRETHGDFRRDEGYFETPTSKYISRQALHAYKLSFNHPVTGEKMEFLAPIPDDIENLIDSIK